MKGPLGQTLLSLIVLSVMIIPLAEGIKGGGAPIQPIEPRPPTIILELDEDEITIETGPGTTGSATGGGTISIEKPTEARTQTVFVDLIFRSFSEEIMGSIYPNIIEMPASQISASFPFEVNLQVDPTISTIDIDGIFEIYGEWYYSTFDSSGDITPVRGNLVLEPFYYFIGAVGNQEELIDVPIGSWVTADLIITNQGNDRVIIKIIEITENQTLDCEIGISSVTLNNKEEKIVPVKLRKNSGPLGESIDTQRILLQANVDGQEINHFVTINIGTVYTPGSFFKSIWFKLIIAGIIILVVLIMTFIIYRKRKRKKGVLPLEVQPT